MLTTELKFSVLGLCDRGEYGAAAELAGLRVGERPENVSGDILAQAEAVLIAGVIASMAAGIQQEGNQDLAREMLTEAVALFGDDSRSAAARYWLAWSEYWSGDQETALSVIDKLLGKTDDKRERFRARILRAIIYSDQGFALRAFEELGQIQPTYEQADSLHRGKFHLERGRVLRLLNECDRAITEYDSAIHFFEEAENPRCLAIAVNNLAGVYLRTGQLNSAHVHVERARSLFHQLGDKAHEAQAWDQTAQIFLAEGNLAQAEFAIGQATLGLQSGKTLSECQETLRKIKQACVSYFQHERVNIRPDPLPHASRNAASPEERNGLGMSYYDLANRLLQLNPDNAEDFYDLFVFAQIASGDPVLDTERDRIEELFYSRTPHSIAGRKSFRSSRLIHEVTSSDS